MRRGVAINGQRVLAVIPARGGSKRCPRKNIRAFRGSPLVAWALDAARRSKLVDEIIVSTEDAEIREVALRLGASVQIRPNELATDEASNEDVLRHVLATHPAEWVVLLQPTSPLRTAEDIEACIERAQIGDGCITYSTGTWAKNGAVYVARREWIEKHDFSHTGLLKLYMPPERSIDIDYPEQFE